MLAWFPVWWYSVGTLRCARWCAHVVAAADLRLGFSVWLRNIFTPMYGARDIASRLISFFVRSVMVVMRGVGVLAVLACMVCIFVTYLSLPVLAIAQLLIDRLPV